MAVRLMKTSMLLVTIPQLVAVWETLLSRRKHPKWLLMVSNLITLLVKRVRVKILITMTLQELHYTNSLKIML